MLIVGTNRFTEIGENYNLTYDPMRLTRDFRETVVIRAACDPAFAKALAEEAEMLFHEGDIRVARRISKNGRLAKRSRELRTSKLNPVS